MQADALPRVAQTAVIGAAEDGVLHLAGLGIVVRQRGVAGVEVSLAEHKDTLFRGLELFLLGTRV